MMNKHIKRRRWIFLAAILLFAGYVYGKYRFGHFNFPLMTILLSVVSMAVALVIFLENRNPAKTIAWLMILSINPLIGLLCYSLFGIQYKKSEKAKDKPKIVFEKASNVENEELLHLALEQFEKNRRNLYHLLKNISETNLTNLADTKVLTNGDETFNAIIEEIRKAESHIHMEYYIIHHDEIGSQIKDELIRKAKEGVHVKILYDFVGSLQLSKKYMQELKDNGVEIEAFGRVYFAKLNNKINFRNHRKIIVIDGKTGFVGGLNIGDEYLGKNKKYGFWRDTHLMIKGEAVWDLQHIFLEDWFYVTHKGILDYDLFCPTEERMDKGVMKIVSSGPNQNISVIKQIIFSMIVSAKKSIYIASPYFIPDEDILSALKTAAFSDVKVKLLLPARPDKKIVFYGSRSYYEELMEAGIEVYAYEKGFLHSKIIVVDKEVATIGTSNMDIRSFNLNFEVNAVYYQSNVIRTLVQNFEIDIAESSKVDLDTFKGRSKKERFYESFSRITSPFL